MGQDDEQGILKFMGWVTSVWSMVAAASLTLAAIYLLVYLRNRSEPAHLFFSLTAIATAAFTFFELWMMHSANPEEFGEALRWSHVPLFVLNVSIAWYVFLYLKAGRLWLVWTVCGMRALVLLLNFLMLPNINYSRITELEYISILGGSVAIARGIPNPWTLLGHATTMALLIFVLDASFTAWKRGDRRKALMVGGSVGFFVLAALILTLTVIWGFVESPFFFGILCMGLISVMAYELGRDVLRTTQLSRELQISQAGRHESDERVSLAVEAGDFGIWAWDMTRKEFWASDSLRQQFGFSPSEKVDFDRLVQRAHPDDREAVLKTHGAAISGTNTGRYRTEFRLLLPDGTTRWVDSRGRVEFDATGPTHVRGASRDVTVRKQVEQEAALLRQELTHAGRVSMMGQLASGLAHEINQPLAAIQRNAEAAAMYLDHPTPDLDEIRAILADIRQDDQRAGQVIGRMRGLLKRRELETQPVTVSALIGDVAALVRVEAMAKHVKLDVSVPAGLPQVQGDRVQLQQVLLNLILNGMDALAGTPAEIRRISITACLDGSQIEVAVSDAGPGIAADHLAKVFDPFFSTKQDGMGMGLAISRTIIEAHGGRLWAQSNPGAGSVFRFTLPLAAGSA